MKFWKKIIKTVKELPITKGATLNQVSKIINNTTNLAKDITKLVGKGRKGNSSGTGGSGEIINTAKNIAQRLKSGTFSLSSKLTKTAKSLGNAKIVPNKRQVL